MFTREALALSDSEKAEVFQNSLETQHQTVVDPSVPSITEVVNEAMRLYSFAVSLS